MRLNSDTAANIAVCCMAAAVTAASLVHIATRLRGSRIAEPFQVGEDFDLPVALPGDADCTAVLIVHSGCRFCTESMPFYRKVVSLRSEVPTFRLVVLALEPVEAATAYLQSHGVQPDAVVPYRAGGRIRLSGTPTLIVVDRSRRVVGAWTGKLAASDERRVLALIPETAQGK